ncbi:MAG: galactokinase [Gammaproteobacteria bacterium]|nr:galactokinase [Gammaproteobacteria bacterium]
MSDTLIAQARALLSNTHGSTQDAQSTAVFAPGRVNLIGEHTDYNDGFVLPCALAIGTAVAIKPRSDHIIHTVSRHVAASGLLRDKFAIDRPIDRQSKDFWGNYLRGVIVAMQQSGLRFPGADIAIVGDIPQGVGLSSSASLTVAIIRAMLAMGRSSQSSRITAQQIARWAQWSEHHFADCQCGLMDQMAAAAASPGEAMLLDCRSLESRQIRVPPAITILVAHSGVERKLATSEYNLRRQQCTMVAQRLGKTSLRDIDIALLSTRANDMSELDLRRARHVLTEGTRVARAVKAIENEDPFELGRCLRESHDSLRYDFEVSVPQVDALVEHLNHTIDHEANGCGGARMTGGGFGGCVVVIVKSSAASAVEAELRRYLSSRVAKPLVLTTDQTLVATA